MHWKIKALLQNVVSKLPDSASLGVYYALQRTCGTLRKVDPLAGLADGLRLVDGIESEGGSVSDKVFLEVGTGRRVNVPIALWLCGAAETITVDVTRYLKPRLILEDLSFLRENPGTVHELFGARASCGRFQERFAVLTQDGLDVPRVFDAARIRYIAPRDAQALPVADESVDYHISNNVLEHIAPDILRRILIEGRRVVRPDGMLVHRVDFSDHFSEIDDRISTVNFLRYSEEQWSRYGGNLYNYHNRLRIDELQRIIGEAGLMIAAEHPEIDPNALRDLEEGWALAPRFADKPKEVNATASALMMLGRPRCPGHVELPARMAERVTS